MTVWNVYRWALTPTAHAERVWRGEAKSATHAILAAGGVATPGGPKPHLFARSADADPYDQPLERNPS